MNFHFSLSRSWSASFRPEIMGDHPAPPQSSLSSPPTRVSQAEGISSESQQKKSYSSAVQTQQTLSKHQFEISTLDGNPIAKIPDDILEDSAPLWDDFLIGRFISTTAPHVAKIHVIVNKIWTLGDKNLKIASLSMKLRSNSESEIRWLVNVYFGRNVEYR